MSKQKLPTIPPQKPPAQLPAATSGRLPAIEEQQTLWDPKSAAIDYCEDTAEELRDALKRATETVATAQAEREKERRAAEEKKRVDDELRAQPLKVGDRVRNKRAYHRGAGTIADVFGRGFHVCYDDGGSGCVDGKDLRRLIPGDSGFEIVEERRAAIEKRLAEYRERHRRPVVGDRVTDDIWGFTSSECPHQGAGTVVFAGDVEPNGYDHGFTIQFDNGVLAVNCIACQLNRLLPEDPDFERSEEVAAGWRAWELKHDVETGEELAASTGGAS